MGRIGIVGVFVHKISAAGIFAQELHATKGWKPSELMSRSWFGREPKLGWVKGKKRRPLLAEAGRLMRGRDLVVIEFKGSTRHLQRHGWYRRQQRKLGGTDALAAM